MSQLHPGLQGAATSRAEAQVLRLSAIYAALDSSSVVGLPHLQAALAVWDYCSASASLLFGDSTGDPIADRIREALGQAPKGLSRNQIRALFHGHLHCDRIDAALQQLVLLGTAGCHSQQTAGRPATLWSAAAGKEQEENEAWETDLDELLAGEQGAYRAYRALFFDKKQRNGIAALLVNFLHQTLEGDTRCGYPPQISRVQSRH